MLLKYAKDAQNITIKSLNYYTFNIKNSSWVKKIK